MIPAKTTQDRLHRSGGKIMNRVLSVLVALCVAFGLAGGASADAFKIGLIADYTGAFATWGPQFQHAIEAYQAINGKSVKGPKGETIDIEMVYRDSASQGPDKAKQLGEELILREKVNMLTGFDLSPHAMAMADLSKQAKVPVVIMNAATGSITRMSPYFVRVSMTVPQMVYPMGKWMVDHGMKSAYVIVSDYAPGHDAEEYFVKAFEKAGGTVVGKARSPLNNVDFSSYVEKVMQTTPKPDVLYIFMPAGTPSINLVKAWSERGLKTAGIKLVGSGETQQIYLKNFSDDIIGTITSNHYTEYNTNPENVLLRGQLKKMFGEKEETDIASIAAWDGIKLIHQSLAALGAKADGLKYVEFMAGKTVDSPRGKLTIDPTERDAINDIYIREVRKVNGELTNVDIDKVPAVKDPWKIDHPPTN
jgi:branched-chain amino acid transport system substrate-binding protein